MGRAFEYRRAAKEKRWDKMSKIFPKLSRAITVATKEGGSDPEMNSKLRAAIQNAKSQNMPKDNINSAIKRANNKDFEDFIEITYEGKGPHGVLVIIECATDNSTRTTANIKSYFNKSNGSLVPPGSLDYMFERKSVFNIKQTTEINLEQLELNLIDFGLEEIIINEDNIFIYGDFKNFGLLQKGIIKNDLKINKSEVQRIPNEPVNYNQEQIIDIEKILDKIDDDDDVQNVFTNIL